MQRQDYAQQSDDYRRIEKAIQFIEDHFKSQPSLDQIAASANLSRYHFDRMFKRWAGISPIQFVQFLTLDDTRHQLAESRSLLDTALAAGLSGPSRLHDLFVTFEAMTPGEFKEQGRGLQIEYGFCDSPFGKCLLAATERGICSFGFIDTDRKAEDVENLMQSWPESRFRENSAGPCPLVADIFTTAPNETRRPFNLLLKGTNFQVNVWKALRRIPEGRVVSYQDIAGLIGRPQSFRAVANAVAINPVAYLIPCHRVITKNGKIHPYRWGSARKKAILGWEAARRA
ncbi:MAG: methylated-DNA--[protein]-cysteine S-methyltransferase [Desulfobacterales bacterium]|nr:methylated-DNA--[protein]-cysteine S-methyltransferase [Desulfobacterales bacterium]